MILDVREPKWGKRDRDQKLVGRIMHKFDDFEFAAADGNFYGIASFQIDKVDEFQFFGNVGMKCTFDTMPGHTGDVMIRKRNQDSFLCIPSYRNSDKQHLMGVFDGHGMYGTEASTFAAQRFAQLFSESLGAMAEEEHRSQDDAVALKLKEGMQQTHEDMVHKLADCSLSGTTAVCCYIDGQHLYCANVGDSRAILAHTVDGRYAVTDLSDDHKADNPGEKERIVNNGGKVVKDWEGGPARVFKKDPVISNGQLVEVPGLAMSRSLGDTTAHEVGVSAEAEILYKKLSPDDRLIIIASDGVWEFMTSHEACTLVTRSLDSEGGWMDLHMAANALINEAEYRWQTQDGYVCDDITVVIIMLDVD